MAAEALSTHTPIWLNARCDLVCEPPENCTPINCSAKDEQMRANASHSPNPFWWLCWNACEHIAKMLLSPPCMYSTHAGFFCRMLWIRWFSHDFSVSAFCSLLSGGMPFNLLDYQSATKNDVHFGANRLRLAFSKPSQTQTHVNHVIFVVVYFWKIAEFASKSARTSIETMANLVHRTEYLP